MNYNVYERCAALLQPAVMHDPADVARDRDLAPNERGIYGWWFDDALLVPDEGVTRGEGRRLLYVGICPNGTNAESKRTLRHRMKEHCRGPIRSSTLRRTLTALLKDELQLSVVRNNGGKRVLLDDGEQRLSDWMSSHARVAWMVDAAPWVLEDELIRTVPLPLNIMGSTHPNARTLRAQRAAPHDY